MKRYPKEFDELSVAIVPVLKELRRWQAAMAKHQRAAARQGFYYEAARFDVEAEMLGCVASRLEATARGGCLGFKHGALRTGGKRVRSLAAEREEE